MHKVLWTASLSNGETVYEEKGNFKTIEGVLSPWQRLLSYIAENDLTITSLSLYTDQGHRYNLPSAGKNPKFHRIIGDALVPYDYKMFRAQASEMNSTGGVTGELYTVIQAYLPEGRSVQVWVDEKNPSISWTIVT